MQAAAGHQRTGGAEVASSSRRGQPLPMPKPRTPPSYPDIHGKYRRQAELNRLTQEISLLEEELRSLEGLPPASGCCKEVQEFIEARSDPLLPLDGEVRRSFRLLRILDVRGQSTSSWDCCFKERSVASDSSRCCCTFLKNLRCSCWKMSCKPCCTIPTLSCFKCSCLECFSRFKCVKCCHPCRKK